MRPLDTEQRTRSDAHSAKILEMLTMAGVQGCTNSQLWTVCHPVNSRISDLRARGHEITATSEGNGVWRYRLIQKIPKPSPFEQRRCREFEQEMPLFARGAA